MSELFFSRQSRLSFFRPHGPARSFNFSSLLVFVILILGCSSPDSSLQDRVCFGQTCFEVEVMRNLEEWQKGMQGRAALDPRHAMLFLFTENKPHSFWMKDTLIPLDIIWMDYARRVVHIASQVPPCRSDPCPAYAPAVNALYVLEILSGQANAAEIKIGDTAEFYLKSR